MIKFLQKNIRYPEEAKNKNIQGRVMVEFVIDTDGLVDDVKVLQGVHPLLDEAAIELVKAMPPWKPGSQDGKFVRVKFSLPIRFQL